MERPAGKELLKVEGLSRSYGQGDSCQSVLNQLDLTLKAGEICVLLGPSGEGKSTLLHLLAGLIRPDAGRIWLNGSELTAATEAQLCQLRRQQIGVVFQFFNLVPTLSVYENLCLPLSLNNQLDRIGEVDALLEQVGLSGKREKFPHQLSGGEQQRVAIVRTLLQRPQLILADEPTGNLDRQNAQQVMALFVQQVRERSGTLLLATHDPSMLKLADRCVRLEQGRLIDA